MGKPVSDKKSQIEMTVLEAALGDGRFVELVNADAEKFNFCARMLGFEEAGFFSERVFEVGVVA